MSAHDDLRPLRADALYRMLTGADPAGHASTYHEVRALRDLAGWPASDRYVALLDLRRAGLVRLSPLGCGTDMTVELLERAA